MTASQQKKPQRDKTFRGNASQFFVAGELCRRGLYAVVTLGNAANTDILCSNIEGTKFVHIQVKTYLPGKSSTCSVGKKAEKSYGENFFWVLGGIPSPTSDLPFEYFVIPAEVMAENISAAHQRWLSTPGKDGKPHNDSSVRTVHIPPHSNQYSWDVSPYRNRWDLIEAKLLD